MCAEIRPLVQEPYSGPGIRVKRDSEILKALPYGTAIEPILQQSRDFLLYHYQWELEPSYNCIFTVESARAGMRAAALEMWRNFWRERCFQIASAFRALDLPDELFHFNATAFAPPLIRRCLPRILPYRVFLAVRRFHSHR
jgi:hypothetical protein